MKSTVSADAAATLAAINAALRRVEDLHWSDPEFQRWEAGQVGPMVRDTIATVDGDPVGFWAARPGPEHDAYGERPAPHIQPMARLVADRECVAACDGLCLDDSPHAYRMRAADDTPDDLTPLPMRDEPDAITQRWMDELHREIRAMGRSYDAQDDGDIDLERYRPVAEEVAW